MAGFDVKRGTVTNLRSRASGLFPKDFTLEDPGPLKHGQMEINGIRFPIDPQGISVHEENYNHAFQTLRNRESTKVRSGHGRISITVRAIFTGVSVGYNADNDAGHSLATINDTLMPILYSLKKMPLCFIDNEIIRRNLPVISGEDENGNLIGENIGAFIKMVNIGTVPGMPHAISAEFQFVWYNHRPFAPRLVFRKDWVDEQEGVISLMGEYEAASISAASRSTTKPTPAGTTISKEHAGRTAFIQNYGHPSIAFNATAFNTYTENIHEARPLKEYLWPYKYESSNPKVSGNQQVFELNKLPPFELQSFDRDLGLGFTVMKAPDKELLDFIAEQLDLRTSSEEKKLAEAKRTNTGPKFGKGFGTTPKTGPMTRAEVNAWAAELSVHPDVLLAAIILWTENRLKGTEKEQRIIVHTQFNNAIRTGGDLWDYAVGARKLTGIQGSGKEFRRYGSSVIPNGNDLRRSIQIVQEVLRERFETGATEGKAINFVHTETQREAHLERLKEIKEAEAAYKLDLALRKVLGQNEPAPPDLPRYIKSPEEIDKSWTKNLDRLSVPGLDSKRIQVYSTKSLALGAAAVKAHAEERLSTLPPQRRVGIAEVTRINLNDAIDIVASGLGLLAGPSTPSLNTAELVKEELGRNKGLKNRREIEALLSLAKDGWTLLINDVTNKPVLINDVSLIVSEDSRTVIPMAINVGFGTNLVMMPLEGHRFPTVQYIGGQHTAGTITLRCEGEDGRRFISELKALTNSDEESAIHFREFSKRRGIAIQNPLLNSLGMKSVFIEDVAVDTVPGSPEGLTVTLRFIDATLNEELPTLLVGKDEVSIESILGEALALVLQKGWINFNFDSRLQVNSIEELDPSTVRLGVSPLTNAENRAKGRIRNYQKKYGLKTFRKNALEAMRKAAQLSSTTRAASTLEEVGKREGRTAVGEAAQILALVLPKQYGGIVREGKVFILPTSVNMEVTQKAIDAAVERDMQRLADYIDKEFVYSEFPRVDVTKLGQANALSIFAKKVNLSSYIGYGGVQIKADIEVPGVVAAALAGTEEAPGLIHKPAFRALFTNITSRLIATLGIAEVGKTPVDPDFAALASLMGDLLEFNPGHVAYPDLMLPPNPITGLVADTTPDFFLFNESDVKMSNSNLAKIVFGADTATLPKKRGLVQGMLAISNTMQGVQDVYGASLLPPDEGSILPADRGRQDIYTTLNNRIHETIIRSGGGSVDQKRDKPNLTGGLLSVDGQPSVTVETDIASRFTISNSLLTGSRNYSRSGSLGYHLQNSIHRKEYVEQPKNLNKVSHTFSKGEYERIFQEFETHYTSEHYAVRRSFPTFKVLFVEENGELSSSDDPIAAKLTKTFALDDFYGVNAIKEIRIVKNKDMATDVCVIELLDLDGVLYNRKYLPQNDSFGLRKTKGKAERNPFLDTVIKEGMKVVVKFGYSNDPTNLETMFVGQIANFEGTHIIQIICQSYGSELVAQRFGTDPSENANFYNVTTGDLLHDLMDREEVRHFGRWKLSDVSLTGALFGVEKLRPDGKVKRVWTWKPSVVDDNLYVPSLDTYLSGWARAWGDLEYVLFDTTIWDCFKEMELRHPGYIAYPVPYGSGADARMTMFFGHPSMIYLSRPAQDIEEIEGEIAGNNINTVKMRETIQKVGRLTKRGSASDQELFAEGLDTLAETFDYGQLEGLRGLARLSSTNVEDLRLAAPSARARLNKLKALLTPGPYRQAPYDSIPSDKFWAATQYFQDGRLRAFRNYELVTSMHDIMLNNIRADHRDTFNSIELRYSDASADLADFAQGSNVETITVNADDNIKDHHIRRNIENYPNCTTTDLARRYASQLLANSLKNTYKGELVILGRPQIKPYDILWVYDNYSDMAGPVEVQEVVHTISAETGFITEVVPHMIVAVKEEVTTIMTDAIGAFFNEHLKEFTTGALVGLSGAGVVGLAGTLLTAGVSSTAGTFAILGGGAGIALPTTVFALDQQAKADGTFDEPEGRPGTSAGLATSAVLATLFKINPIIPCAAGIVAGALLYKILKYNSTREPIIITPLIKQGKPYVTGVEGMESDGLILTDYFNPDRKDAVVDAFGGRRWRYFIDGIDEAMDLIEVGWANWMAQP